MKIPTNLEITRQEIETAIDTYMVLKPHSERNRLIMKRRLIDGRTHEQLSEEFDLSVQAIQKILYKNERLIFSHIIK